jgi:RHS repeat-associated protein
VVVAITLIGVACVAGVAPAIRAARVPPAEALTAVDEFRRTLPDGTARRAQTLFDGFGRARTATEYFGPQDKVVTQVRSYDLVGRLESETDPAFAFETAPQTRFDYDPLDRLTQETLPGSGRVETTSYDRGLVTLTDANANVTERRVDVFGRIVEVRELGLADGPYVTRYDYDALGQLVQVTDHPGNVTLVGYDRLGRKRSVMDPDSGLTTFDYDGQGNLIERTDARGHTVTWTYDPLDRRTSRTIDGASTPQAGWQYDTAPNGIGLLEARGDNAGAFRVLEYDLLGRPTKTRHVRAKSNLDFETTYDQLGQVASRTFPGGQTIDWVRDLRGYLIAVDGGGQPYATQIEWDARGRLVHWVAGNGVETTTAYEPTTGRLDSIQVESASQLLERLEYHFDPGDRVFAIDDVAQPTRDRSFDYDALDRLVEATGPYSPGFAPVTWYYHYDAIGNLECMNSPSLSTCTGPDRRSFAFPGPGSPRPHAPTAVTSATGTYPITHDDAGNLYQYHELGSDWTLTHNELGQLTSAERGGVTQANFVYDALGALTLIQDLSSGAPIAHHLVSPDFEWNAVDQLGRIHVQIGSQIIATQEYPYNPPKNSQCGLGAELALVLPLLLWLLSRGARGSRRRRVLLTGVLSLALATAGVAIPVVLAPAPAAAQATPTLVYYHGDHLGSSVLRTDASGGVVERTVYAPFGQAVPASAGGSTDAPEFGFTGQRYVGALGIYYYGSRWYHPLLGRFAQADSFVPQAEDPQSLNRYSYVRNNPLNRFDPEGDIDIGAEVGHFFGGLFGDEETGELIGSIVGGFVPGVGELADIDVLTDDEAGLGTKVLAGASLGINVLTAGAAPNFGSAARGTLRVADRALSTAEDSVRLTRKLEKTTDELLHTISESAEEAASASTRQATGGRRVFERVVSKAELEATQSTGLLRGGRPGRNFFTNSASLDAKRAQQRLGLDGPLRDFRIRFSVADDVKVTGPGRVPGGLSGTPGGGREFFTDQLTLVEILRIDPLRK